MALVSETLREHETELGGAPVPQFTWPQVLFYMFRQPDERSIFPNKIFKR